MWSYRSRVRATPRRRTVAALLAGAMALGVVTACDDGEPLAVGDAQLDGVLAEAMEAHSLRSMLVRVTIDGEPRYELAIGESMTGVPASSDMHLRIGAFGFTLMSTLLMVLVDNGEVTLEDPLSNWFPELPQADEVTLRDLAQMTSGYADYVYQPEILNGFGLDPYRQWTSDELIEIGLSVPLQFDPGTNWAYSHTNYVILGRVLEEVTGMPLDRALRRFVLLPMHTTTTTLPSTPAMPEPVLHSFSSERRFNLDIPDDLPFYEDRDVLEPFVDDGAWSGRCRDDRRLDHDHGGGRHRRAAVRGVVPRTDRAESRRIRPCRTGLRRLQREHGGDQLRAGHPQSRRLDDAGHGLRRTERYRWLHGRRRDRLGGRDDLPARGVERER